MSEVSRECIRDTLLASKAIAKELGLKLPAKKEAKGKGKKGKK